MLVHKPDDDGFGLVEMIIAFFLLALIAVAILPALYNGLRYSSGQSSAATATRALNAQIEQLRNNPLVACSDLQSAANPGTTTQDGRGRTIFITGPAPVCTTPHLGVLTLNAKDATGAGLATVSAKIYLP